MNLKRPVLYIVASSAIIVFSGCATIVNDPNIPVAVTFSDGSTGQCEFKNKRGVWKSEIPTTGVMIRRSDDDLLYDCSTKDGRTATGSIRSEMEGEKMAASVIFWDLGITDAITDKHRTYQGNVVIPVSSEDEYTASEEPKKLAQSEASVDPLDMSVGGNEDLDADDPGQGNNDPQ